MAWHHSIVLALASATAAHAGPAATGVERSGSAAAGEVVVRDCFGRRPMPESRARPGGSAGPPPPSLPTPLGASAQPASASPKPTAKAPSSKKKFRAEQEAILATIGTRGDASGGGSVEDLFSGGDGGQSLDEALAGASGVAVAQPHTPNDAKERRPEAPPVRQPAIDWGGTVYLSNDDSMSLASAQRLLWAVDQGRSFTTSQVRPHELLNYFSFDTVPAATSRLFSVHASALRTQDDELTVALSVRGAQPPPLPLDLTVVVDRSGSMRSDGRMDFTKRGLRIMAEQLSKGDRVDVVLFDDRVCTPLENYVVGRDDPALLDAVINDMKPRGGTDLNIGLREAYGVVTDRSAADRRGRNQRIMLLTDAQMNTGTINPDVVSDIGKAFDEHQIRLTGVGVGKSFNDKVLNMLTEKGKGAYVFLGTEAVVDRIFGVGFPSLVQTIAHDVHFALDLPDTMAMERFYGEEASTVKEAVQPIHYYAGTSQLFLQDLKVRRPKRADTVELTVTYSDATTGQAKTERFRYTLRDMMAADTHNVHKARALMSWTDLLLAQAMGQGACDEPAQTYADRASLVPDDVEVAYVSSLVEKQCGPILERRLSAVTYKVKLDSDVPIAEVSLLCGDETSQQRLGRGESVAVLQGQPGACTLTLMGNVPMTASVRVPQTGADVRCMVRGGRMECS
jgi:Ca-activated chloride channel homolog